jgi:glycosyltransferase involved in cell wall biosynthesis
VRIVSVSTEYPGPRNPRGGLFIQRRLAALARVEDVRVIHLQPWFPVLRPRPAPTPANGHCDVPPAIRPGMFYLPGILKGLDSYWVKRVVLPAIRALDGEARADVIDAHFGYPEGVGCVKAALALRRPVFITMRGLERPMLQTRWRGAQVRWALRRCTGVVSVSESLKELALAQGVAPDKVRVIPNAVDRELFRPGDCAAARASLGIEPGARWVVCVAMLVHGKGQHLLVEALARLAAAHPDARLALVGGSAHEPKYPEALRRRVAELGLAGRVLLPGSQPPERVAAWLQAADLFALPTFDEGCCNAVIEAMACGLPVVTTPAGDNARLIDAPRRGLLVPVDDAAGLAAGLDEALRRPWDRQAIAAHGAGFGWDDVARQTAQFFRERVAAAGPRGPGETSGV